MRQAMLIFLWVCVFGWACVFAQTVPVLEPGGKQVRVRNVGELTAALNGAVNGRTIVLADGVYDVSSVEPLRVRADSLTLYGESRDPSKAVLKGRGFAGADRSEEMFTIEAARATLAYLTLRDVRGNGLKLQSANHDLLVHNVHFIDICERSIKSTELGTARNGTVRYCRFEQLTPITSAIPNLQYEGDYIAGIDLMSVEGWVIRDNVFKNIRGMNGRGRAGVFLWRGCKNVVVERNAFVGCDRAVSFGNPAPDSTPDMQGGVLRNNFIVAGAGNAIEICNAVESLVAHNTVFSNDPGYARTVFFYNGGAGNALKNNLILGNLFVQGGLLPDTSNNLFLSSASGWFADPSAGDLHLTAAATAAIDKGALLSPVPLDFDNGARDAKPDIGADEYLVGIPPTPDPGNKKTGPAMVCFKWRHSVYNLLGKKLRLPWPGYPP